MNFAPFTGHIPSAAAIPSIHQFAAKFGYEGGGAAAGAAAGVQFAVAPAVMDAKFRPAEGVVVVSAAPPTAVALAGIAPIHTVNTGVKYQTISSSSVSLGYGGAQYAAELKGEQRDKREYREDLHHDIMATMMQQQVSQAPLSMGTQQLVVVLADPKDAALRPVKQEARADRAIGPNDYITVNLSGLGDVSDASWQLGSVTGVAGVTGVADYLSALPLPLHHLLKYSADKRDDQPTVLAVNALPAGAVPVATMVAADNSTLVVAEDSPAPTPPPAPTSVSKKSKKKKKNGKEKKPRPVPGEIRLTTALDGSTLYCCPECHMAYPERGLLQQHLLGHTMERRFICDICNAALKRKDHLTRHKQSHNPERPHTCSVCMKAFKRKEQLTLHFVIHSGEKRHVCTECGKGFYRKDHLRKHTRSHIARRVKAELSAGGAGAAGDGGPPLPAAVPAPQPEPS